MINHYWIERPIRQTVLAAWLSIALTASPLAFADVTLNFVNADIDQIARAVGAATGKTIVVDPRVKGQLNLQSDTPVSDEQALKTLQAALRMQGFALLQDHGVLKVVPEADAKIQGVPTFVGNRPRATGDQVVTQIFRLHNESANSLLPVLRPLISPNNTIAAYPSNNTIVVTDYADNIRRIGEIIAGIDSAAGNGIEVVQLNYANAIDVAATAQKLLDPGAIGETDATLKVNVSADTRTNSVILRASDAQRLKQAEALVVRLDAPTREPGNIHVVALRNADAAGLAKTLRSMLGQSNSGSSKASSGSTNSASGSQSSSGLSNSSGNLPPLPSGTGSSSSTTGTSSSSSASGYSGLSGSSGSNANGSGSDDDSQSGDGMVVADTATNSLIITAPEPVYRNLRNVIAQLDRRRVQVYIESLIMEVSSDKEGQFGIQWLTPTGIASIAASATNVGFLHSFGTILGTKGLLQALATNTDVNVLSTPSLVTLDNQEARILVGTNVPIESGSYSTGTSTTTGVTAFNTFDRKDVGIMLNVKPQISQGGTIKLQVYQEDSSVETATASQAGGYTIDKRSLQTTVLADDGQIVVLGGLMKDQYSNANSKIPWVSKIPVLGILFRNETKSRIKTNLLIFLRPVIIKDAETLRSISLNRYDYMRAAAANYRTDNWLVKEGTQPVLPPVDPDRSDDLATGQVNGTFDLTGRTRRADDPALSPNVLSQPPYAPDPLPPVKPPSGGSAPIIYTAPAASNAAVRTYRVAPPDRSVAPISEAPAQLQNQPVSSFPDTASGAGVEP